MKKANNFLSVGLLSALLGYLSRADLSKDVWACSAMSLLIFMFIVWVLTLIGKIIEDKF